MTRTTIADLVAADKALQAVASDLTSAMLRERDTSSAHTEAQNALSEARKKFREASKARQAVIAGLLPGERDLIRGESVES